MTKTKNQTKTKIKTRTNTRTTIYRDRTTGKFTNKTNKNAKRQRIDVTK